MLRRIHPFTSLILLALVLASGAVWAQGPGLQGGVSNQSTLGTAFTYQGRLMWDGAPINDTCDFQFQPVGR